MNLQVIVNLLDEPGKLMPMMGSLRRLSAISTAPSGLDLSIEDLGSPNLIDLLGPSTSVCLVAGFISYLPGQVPSAAGCQIRDQVVHKSRAGRCLITSE